MEWKDSFKEWWSTTKEKFASEGDRRKRVLKEQLLALWQNLAALEEDPDTGKKHITTDTIKTWMSYACSIVMSLLCGLFSYWYVGSKVEYFRYEMFLYQTGSMASPPSVLWLIVTIIWCGIVAVAVSLVALGVVWVCTDLILLRELEYHEDVRMTGIALGCMLYVILVLIMWLLKVPVPSAYSPW